MARGSFDSDVIAEAGTRLAGAGASLHDLSQTLGSLPCGSLPGPIADAIGELNSKGHDMMTDIDDETAGMAGALGAVADAYASLESSLVNSFSGGSS